MVLTSILIGVAKKFLQKILLKKGNRKYNAFCPANFKEQQGRIWQKW